MKRTAVSVVAAIMVLYTVYFFGPNTAHETLSTRTNAQEPAAQKESENPFSDPPGKTTTPAPTAPKKVDEPKGPLPGKPAKTSNAGSRAPNNPTEFVEARLSQPGNFEFPDTPLQDVVDSLGEKLGIPIVIDKKALEDAGIGTDKTVNLNLRGLRTDKCLELMLGELELTWVVRDGYVLITTIEKLESLLEVRVYNCSDLIEMVKATTKPKQGGFGGGAPAPAPPEGATPPGRGQGGFFAVPPGEAGSPDGSGGAVGVPLMGSLGGSAGSAPPELVPDTDSLIDLIQTTLVPDSWADAGGYGSIEPYHGGLIVINHDGPTHRRIEMLLNMMRQAKQAEPGTVVRER